MDKETIDLYTDKVVANIANKLENDSAIQNAQKAISAGKAQISEMVEKIVRGEIKDCGESLYANDICKTLQDGQRFYSEYGSREIHSYVKRTITQLFVKKMFSSGGSEIDKIIDFKGKNNV